MTNEFDQLRAVLTQNAKAAAADVGYPIQLPNAPFNEPSDAPWINFWFRIGDTGQAELGGPAALEISVGLLQFDVLVPEQTGDGLAIQIANRIKKKINRKQWLVPPNGYVTLYAASLTTELPAKSGWYRVCVDTVFSFHHRDPDAEPFRDF